MMSGSGFISLWHLWGLGSIVLWMSSMYYWRSTINRIPASIPWAGFKDEPFSKPRAWIRELFAGLSTLHEGYFTHNQKGKPFMLLDTAGRPNVILPKENARWLAGQPEHILSSRKVTNTKFAVQYLAAPMPEDVDVGMISAVRRDLTRNLGRTQKTSFEIIRHHTDQLMGTANNNPDDNDNPFTEVNLFNLIESIIGAVSNQMLVGDKLFYNEAFMASLASFGHVYGLASLVIGQFLPFFVRPIIGFLAGLVVKVFRRRALKFLIPAAQERIDEIKKKRENQGREDEAPLDILQWVTLACLDAGPEEIAAAILTLVLGATHTSISITTAVFLDLLSSPPELGYYEAIAEEAASVFHKEEDFWDLKSLYKLTRIDSAIRESMRHSPLSGRGIMKEVVHPNGITLPGGQEVPSGVWLGVSISGISQDERYYPDPHKYDPFRFSRARTEVALLERNKKNGNTDHAASTTTTATTKATDKVVTNEKTVIDVDSLAEPIIGKVDDPAARNQLNGSWLSTTTEDFGLFGLGRRSCPGRWFASHIMKITLAYIVLNYEIQPIHNRPSNIIIGDMIIPPRNATIMVRRRKTFARGHHAHTHTPPAESF